MKRENTNQSEYNKLCIAKANWLDMILAHGLYSDSYTDINLIRAFNKLDERDQNLLDEHYETERK
ncbi:hypothetical protein [Streptococcus porcinus]|uniref:Uncharacterized protein n=1 Tax=Streptococcus porcinus TaxID=1340 RepID=A0A7W0ART1_STRPO|nr:hypothetical protein [Streptococcus porcinus]MBA2796591.1 hypothetical protein [Streptococcus porcinus]